MLVTDEMVEAALSAYWDKRFGASDSVVMRAALTAALATAPRAPGAEEVESIIRDLDKAVDHAGLILTDPPQPSPTAALSRRAIAALRSLLAERALLTDPAAVRVNILRGTIARPDDLVWLHDEAGPVADLRRERDALANDLAIAVKLHDDMKAERDAAIAERDRLREALKDIEAGPWCQPKHNGSDTPRKFMVWFEDPEAGYSIFDDEVAARAAWEEATTSWNCYLFATMPMRSAAIEAEIGATTSGETGR